MKITIENYERYALDFLEGHLGHKDEVEFQQFLDDHPEIKEELQGIDHVVLIPDMELQYPNKANLYHKKRIGIVPLWNTSRLIAAAVAFLLISATVFFIRDTTTTPVESLTDNHPVQVETPTAQKELPATKTPMPAEQPVASVMARKGNAADTKENIVPGSPALTFGSKDEDNQPNQVQPKNSTTNEDIASEIIPVVEIPNHESQVSDQPVDALEGLEELKSIPRVEQTTALALLPVKSGRINSDRTINISNLASFSKDENSATFEFHIPGQFLSETWTDVSLSNFKDQILPEFIKNRQKL